MAAALVGGSAGCGGPTTYSGRPLDYPKAKKVDQVDDYHGTKVADPYRWLEDDNSAETKAWVEAENKVTFGYLEQIPARGKIKSRLTKLWDYEKYGVPFKEGGRYFFSKNDGLQNQNVVYTAEQLDGAARVLIDPNTLSADGTVALAGYTISDDGRYMAYGISDAGSDWVTYRVRDIATGHDTSDEIKWVKFSGASWTSDNNGFFYSRYDEPNEAGKLMQANYFHKLYYHRLGTPQSEDVLVYERPDEKEWGFAGSVTDDGRYLILTVWKGTEQKNRVFFKDLQDAGAKVVELLNDFDAEYNFIDNDGPVFFFQTDLNASRGRVIAVNTHHPAKADWKELIPESKATLQGVTLVGDRFICSYLKDAYSEIKLYDLGGTFVRDVELPGLGTAGGFGGKRSDTETFYSYTSFATPATVYRYDIPTGTSTVFKQPTVDFNPADFETKQIFYSSKDGTQIPMFITHRKGLELDGNNPTYLYGYGGFKASMTPFFSVSNVVWMEMGGVYAMANLRGGGEYGQDWHDAGRLKNKQNVFDDFIAAGEWLIANQYTRSERLAIGGGSNGGLLVGACMTQRPDLFGAALPAVGVMDMLRFHKFTIGWAWKSDYGCSEDPDEFKTQFAYSPLHNIKPGKSYPATLVTTADHDDRVVPAHSFKFAAALQEAQAGKAPVLIRIETRAGHGAGKPTTKIIEEQADKWGFLVRTLGMDDSKIRG
ncbi:MAG TPA: prolyl oligopeptidase family serine peptidase [Phycisphaerae bacterium]|nr:prolyl oligopeptidase family serine peptidase [Phycisphaerae bacterium]